jgi:ectoine hydroxylase-related dioxygenase (phytanoyl-CoA dioxygenase family)
LPAIGKLVGNLVDKFGNINLLRAKVNVTSPYPPMMKYESQVPHVDLQYDNGDPVEHMVLLYYVNESDGPTYFFNEAHELQDTVYPKPGRAIIFDGNTIHAASNPVKHPFRIAVNIDFEVMRNAA